MWTYKATAEWSPRRLDFYQIAFLAWTVCGTLLAMLLMSAPAHAEEDYLDPETAFKFSARMVEPQTVQVTFEIADGYYMYRERFGFRATGAELGEANMPAGKVKFDDTFQKDVETYRHSVSITIPLKSSQSSFTLIASSQGCADKGLCYAPMESRATLYPSGKRDLLAAITGADSQASPDLLPKSSETAPGSGTTTLSQGKVVPESEMGGIESSLKSGSLYRIVPLFLLLGLGLAFTPCVLPMVPILSFIIVGEGVRANRMRGFILSATYSLGMALVYTVLGIAAGLLGEGLSATLQNPWMLGLFGIVMTAFALSMFGFYQLQMPASIQTALTKFSEKQTAGKLAGVFVMGAVSALIVGPCVAAPLAGALIYISQTRDVVIGGSALFSMAVGMSIPLLLVGVSAGALLPRAGAWMESVKRFFGVLMLGLAWWIVSPLMPAAVQMIGWAVLALGYGAYLLGTSHTRAVGKGIGMAVFAFGLAQLVGVSTGGRDAWSPLAHLYKETRHVTFQRVRSIDELNAAIAGANGKTVMLDFYADWCVSCKEMEKLTFVDPRIQERFANMLLLQADVTENNANDKALLKKFRLFGPPGILFFDKQGKEIEGARVIGYQDSEKFLKSLDKVSGS